MLKVGRVVGLLGALALVAPTTAFADGFQSYKVCGGFSFTTCAAVQVSVTGSDVSVRIWNLSGNTAATYGTASNAGTIFTGIGFYNLPAGIDAVSGSLTINGPSRPGDTPGQWTVTNNGRVDFIVDVAARGGGTGANGISSGCAVSAQLPGPSVDLYQNPCGGNLSSNADFVTLSFKISGGTWNPSTSAIVLRGVDGVTGHQVECWTGANPLGNPGNCTTVTPEPVTMTLLASGLAGIGGMGFIRRRRKSQNTVA